MQQIGIDGEGGFAAFVFCDGDLVRFGKFQEFGAARQIPFAPRGDDFDVGVERVGGQFKADLIVALAGCTVGHGIGAGFFGDFHEAFGDQRAGDGGAQEVETLVDRVGAEHREDEVADEFLAHVFDVDVLWRDAHHLGLFAGRFQLFTLAEVGGEGHHLAAIFGLQPFQDDRGIEAAGIGKHDFLGRGHDGVPFKFALRGSGFRGRGQD